MNYTTAKISLLGMFLVTNTVTWGMKVPSREVYVFKKDINQVKRAVRYQQANPKRYHCDQCQYSTSQRNYMLRHKELHDEKNNFKCDYCGFLTRHHSSLSDHLGRHQGPNYYCAVGTCNLMFKNMHSLNVHVKREHGDSLRNI